MGLGQFLQVYTGMAHYGISKTTPVYAVDEMGERCIHFYIKSEKVKESIFICGLAVDTIRNWIQCDVL